MKLDASTCWRVSLHCRASFLSTQDLATVETGVKSGETKLNSTWKARFEWIDGSITAYLPAARAVGEPLESPVGHGGPCAVARVPKPLMSSIVTPFFGNHEQVCGMLFGLKNDPEILIHGDGQTNRHEPRLSIENASLGCYQLNFAVYHATIESALHGSVLAGRVTAYGSSASRDSSRK